MLKRAHTLPQQQNAPKYSKSFIKPISTLGVASHRLSHAAVACTHASRLVPGVAPCKLGQRSMLQTHTRANDSKVQITSSMADAAEEAGLNPLAVALERANVGCALRLGSAWGALMHMPPGTPNYTPSTHHTLTHPLPFP